MSEPTREFVALPDGRVWTLQWRQAGQGAPWLVFAHATGMCAELYRDLLAPLAESHRVLAFDARGHGRTELPMACSPDWALNAADMAALAAAVCDGPAVLAGHSFGGSTAAQCAAAHPELARAVVMIDPAYIPFGMADPYRATRDSSAPPPNRMAEQARRRRALFDSREAMRAAYAGRGVFADWPDGALDAYIDGGAHPTPEGFALLCTPDNEADTFLGVTTRLRESLEQLRCPATLLHATEGSTVEQADADAMAAMGLTVRRFDGAGHFLPVTHADAVRPWLAAAAGNN